MVMSSCTPCDHSLAQSLTGQLHGSCQQPMHGSASAGYGDAMASGMSFHHA